MVSAINSVNQYPIDRESLEVMRRLQSLGVVPSGNLMLDRQRLQTAELQKKQTTLAANSEVNLTRLEGTGNDFSSTIKFLQNSQPTSIKGTEQNNKIGLIRSANHDMSAGNGVVPFADNSAGKKDLQYRMIGAEQLAELNKLKLGLIA